MKQFKRRYLKSITLLAIVLIATIGIVYANTPVRAPIGFDKPDGFNKVVVFMAAGKYNETVPPAEGDLATWFHKTIMGRSNEEIQSQKSAAKAYFERQFGPGLPEPVAFGLDPRNEYRAYFISGEDIPSEGWVVRDGGFRINFMAPTTLHGEWGGTAGKTVPAGSVVVFGDYNIDVTRPDRDVTDPSIVVTDPDLNIDVSGHNIAVTGPDFNIDITGHRKSKSGKHPLKPLIIHYQSAEPIIPDTINGGVAFRCTLIAPWGEGIAQGISFPQKLGNGIVQANIRNVQTYPAYGPSIVHNP